MNILFPFLQLEPVADLPFGPCGFHHVQVRVEPVAARPAPLGGQHLDLVPRAKNVVQRNLFPVDTGAAAAVANLRVNVIGKIDRSRALRQIDDIALGGEHIDPVLEDLGFHHLNEFPRILNVFLPVHHPPQPLHARLEGFVLGTPILVAPVCGNPKLGLLVHLRGPDLHLELVPIIEIDRSVNALVIIVLGIGDVIVKLAGQRPPFGMDDPQADIT